MQGLILNVLLQMACVIVEKYLITSRCINHYIENIWIVKKEQTKNMCKTCQVKRVFLFILLSIVNRTLFSENEGVDLNRNFNSSFEYDNKGSSPSGCAEDFRGEQPFSEPETQAIRDFLLQNKMNIVLNIHSYGKYSLYYYHDR